MGAIASKTFGAAKCTTSSPITDNSSGKQSNGVEPGQATDLPNTKVDCTTVCTEAAIDPSQTANGETIERLTIADDVSRLNGSPEVRNAHAPGSPSDHDTSTASASKKRSPMQWLIKRISFKRTRPIGEDVVDCIENVGNEGNDTTQEVEPTPNGHYAGEVNSEAEACTITTAPLLTLESSHEPNASCENVPIEITEPVREPEPSNEGVPERPVIEKLVEEISSELNQLQLCEAVSTSPRQEAHVSDESPTRNGEIKVNGYSRDSPEPVPDPGEKHQDGFCQQGESSAVACADGDAGPQ